MSPINKYP